MIGPSFKQRLRRLWPGLFALSRGLRLLYSSRSYLVNAGYTRSCGLREPRDAEDQPLPWMNYPVIHFLKQRLTRDLSLFEYGSGFSTIFYSRLVGQVLSIEHSQAWYDRVTEMVPGNVEVRLVELGQDAHQYVNAAIQSGRKYDVLVVDGRERVACISAATGALSERGVLILDDSARERYQSGVEYLQALGFRQIDFVGLKPAGLQAHQTTIFYRDRNCLGI